MSEVTPVSMRDARDAFDRELLARGEIDELLAGYVDEVVARCRLRCRAHETASLDPVDLDDAAHPGDGAARDGERQPKRKAERGDIISEPRRLGRPHECISLERLLDSKKREVTINVGADNSRRSKRLPGLVVDQHRQHESPIGSVG